MHIVKKMFLEEVGAVLEIEKVNIAVTPKLILIEK
jgi:hypothetical protein